jgi:spore maturation protein CgeB
MRILFAGEFLFECYESACAAALERLGHEVVRFSWQADFGSRLGRVERYGTWVGPVTRRVNQALLRALGEHQVDVLLCWRGANILPETLKAIRSRYPRCILVSYNNDDPFSPLYDSAGAKFNQRRLWRLFKACVPHYDLHFVFRSINVAEMRQAGAKQVRVLMPYFMPELHHPVTLTAAEQAQFDCDVAFIGHYEPDGRERYLAALVQAGLKVKLYGNSKYWLSGALGDLADYFGEIREVRGADYVKALSGAKMCLCFLSKLNRDTYTTRCFEIPAVRQVLLSQRTDDLTRMFQEDQEAVYFSSPEELVQKALWLKSSPETARAIAQAGYDRVNADAHSVDGRMREFVAAVESLQLLEVA